mgnify:CR=1 FL=1
MMKAQILILLLLFTTSLKAAVSIIPIPQKCVERKGNFIVNKFNPSKIAYIII